MPGERKNRKIFNRAKELPALAGFLAPVLMLSAPAAADSGEISLWALWPALAVGVAMGGGLGAIFFALRRFKGHGTAHEGGEAETFREIADFAGDWSLSGLSLTVGHYAVAVQTDSGGSSSEVSTAVVVP